MNRKWASLILVAGLALATGCNKGTSTNSATDSSQQGAAGTVQQPTLPPEPPKPLVVAAGTELPVILSSTINSRTANPGDEFEGSVATDILVDNEVAIPKGSHVTGAVVNAKKQGTFKGEAVLSVKLTRLEVKGKGYAIATNTYGGTQKGKGKRTAAITGGGAAVGALIGGLAGGGKGAAIGAGVGAGGGLAASGTTGGKNVEFPAESRITFQLTEEITIKR